MKLSKYLLCLPGASKKKEKSMVQIIDEYEVDTDQIEPIIRDLAKSINEIKEEDDRVNFMFHMILMDRKDIGTDKQLKKMLRNQVKAINKIDKAFREDVIFHTLLTGTKQARITTANEEQIMELKEDMSLICSRYLIEDLEREFRRKFKKEFKLKFAEELKNEKDITRQMLWMWILTDFREDNMIKFILQKVHSSYPQKFSNQEKEEEFIRDIKHTYGFLSQVVHREIALRNRNQPPVLSKEVPKNVLATIELLKSAKFDFWSDSVDYL